eukprot:Opistho-2@48268
MSSNGDAMEVTAGEEVSNVDAAPAETRGGKRAFGGRRQFGARRTGAGANSVRENRVYVGNLAYSVRWQELKDLMGQQIGEVVFAEVFEQPNGMSKGCGIVEFVCAEDAQKAIQTLNDTEISGRRIFVREDRETGAGSGAAAPAPAHFQPRAVPVIAPVVHGDRAGNQVLVGNLDYGVSWQDLKDFFRTAGTIVRADIIGGPDGRSRGQGTVLFEHPHEAQKAIEVFNGQEFHGRSLDVHLDRYAINAYGAVPTARPLQFQGYAPINNGFVHAHAVPVPMNGVEGSSGCQVFITNLPYTTTWQDLKDTFRQAGNIIRADVLMGADGRSRGQGTILFQSADEASRAISMFNGSAIEGRNVEVRLDKYA